MEDDFNPYAPPNPGPEPLKIKGRALSHAIPLLKLLVGNERDENGKTLVLIIQSTHSDSKGYEKHFYYSGDNNVSLLSAVGKYCNHEQDQSAGYYEIKDFNLEAQGVSPAPYTQEEKEELRNNTIMIRHCCQQLGDILIKYYPDEKDPYMFVKGLKFLSQDMQAIEATLDNGINSSLINPNKPYHYGSLKASLGVESSYNYYFTRGYSRYENIGSEDKKKMEGLIALMRAAYKASEDSFHKAEHHVLYEQALRGVELETSRGGYLTAPFAAAKLWLGNVTNRFKSPHKEH